ncbi:DUF4198 domain-containing protein [Croceivirga thetidis]|uniref:DUF4198 domain-containing protein n=1 Tax=Croceivirga thetidis TaxID=2721623 RepID=A0ABX1GKM2_9FLAO|nr:DUF4198 domain-containing protein [Croceivirga thetidis]NKI30458.1 DUF4198 domain-containing protein [Croceivirga thetidis]
MGTYFLESNQDAIISLFNGTFERSENIITRDRMLDASLVGQGDRLPIDPDWWKDQDSTITQLTLNSGDAGTYMVGVSTKARNIELTSNEFNDYLKHDGILDMLEQRTNDGVLDQDAVESYQKHVKAIYQVGEKKTNDWSTVLGYPIEFVPQANPYDSYSGEKLEVQVLLDGQPLSNQLVYADYIKSTHSHSHHTHEHDSHGHSHDDGHSHDEEHSHEGHTHSHDSDEGHTHTSGQKLRTNEKGMVNVNLPEDGIYYLRTIHMVQVTNSEELTHESKWATLSFEVTHEHSADTHTHDHDHEEGISTWIFILASILIIGALFLVFRKKK